MNDWRNALAVALPLTASGIVDGSTEVKAWRVVDTCSAEIASVMGGPNPVRNGQASPVLHLTSEGSLPPDGSDGSMMMISGIIARARNANRS
jgi:hypothetical protein